MFHMPMSSPMMKTMLGCCTAPAHAAPAIPNTAARVNANPLRLNSLLFPSLISEPSWPHRGDVSDGPRPLGNLDGGAELGRPHIGVCPSRCLAPWGLGQHRAHTGSECRLLQVQLPAGVPTNRVGHGVTAHGGGEVHPIRGGILGSHVEGQGGVLQFPVLNARPEGVRLL